MLSYAREITSENPRETLINAMGESIVSSTMVLYRGGMAEWYVPQYRFVTIGKEEVIGSYLLIGEDKDNLTRKISGMIDTDSSTIGVQHYISTETIPFSHGYYKLCFVLSSGKEACGLVKEYHMPEFSFVKGQTKESAFTESSLYLSGLIKFIANGSDESVMEIPVQLVKVLRKHTKKSHYNWNGFGVCNYSIGTIKFLRLWCHDFDNPLYKISYRGNDHYSYTNTSTIDIKKYI